MHLLQRGFLTVLMLGLAAGFAFEDARAQEVAAPTRWVSASVGYAFPNGYDFSGGLSFNFGEERLYQVSLNGGKDFVFLGLGQRPQDLGALPFQTSIGGAVGKGFFGPGRSIAAFAGPALIVGRRALDEDPYVTGGLDLNAQVFFRLFDGIAVGFDTHLLLNPVQSNAGIRLAVRMSDIY